MKLFFKSMLVVFLFVSTAANAKVESASFDMTFKFLSSCNIEGNATNNLQLNCTKNTFYNIEFLKNNNNSLDSIKEVESSENNTFVRITY